MRSARFAPGDFVRRYDADGIFDHEGRLSEFRLIRVNAERLIIATVEYLDDLVFYCDSCDRAHRYTGYEYTFIGLDDRSPEGVLMPVPDAINREDERETMDAEEDLRIALTEDAI